MKTIKHDKINTPFLNDAVSVFLESDQAAKPFGFPEGGRWYRVDDFWELREELRKDTPYEHDDSLCDECQGWGAPSGCRTCGMFCMGG